MEQEKHRSSIPPRELQAEAHVHGVSPDNAYESEQSPDSRARFQEPRKDPKGYRVVRGEQLSNILDRDVCLDWKTATAITTKLCAQASILHRKGKTLGDLSPSTVIVELKDGQPGSVRLLCAEKSIDDDSLISYKESSSALPHETFLSPEQKRRFMATPQSDVYAIGAVLYAAITGTPFEHTLTTRLFFEDSIRDNLSHFQVPPHIVNVIARCLRDDPAKRFRSADELHTAISYPHRTPPQNRSIQRAHVKLACLIAACFFLAGGMFSLLKPQDAPDSAATAVISQNNSTRKSPRIAFNKSMSDYHFGDLVTVTVTPAEKLQRVFLFYIDDHDHVASIYPTRDIPGGDISAPMEIRRVGENSMFVNRDDGRFVLVSLTDNDSSRVRSDDVLRDTDWSNESVSRHTLSISGATLMQRLERLQTAEPEKLSLVVQEAPKCSNQSVISTADQ